MTISDDQLTVTLADSSFTNDSSTDIICSDEPEAGDGCSSQSTDTFSVVTSTAAAPMSTATLLSSRFTVQPAFPPQSVKLNHDYHNNEPDCLDSVAPPSAPPELGEVEVSAFQGREVFFPESETRKKVSFPEGEALIKGFAHAPNPWYNGRSNSIRFNSLKLCKIVFAMVSPRIFWFVLVFVLDRSMCIQILIAFTAPIYMFTVVVSMLYFLNH